MSQDVFRLDGQVVAVIGSASGIGAAAAHLCAASGATVVCCDKDDEGGRRVADEIRAAGGAASSLHLDIVQGAAVDEAFARVMADHGRLDGVVSTPSVNVRKPILKYAEEELDRVLTLNLKGSFHVLRAAGRLMIAKRRGSIVLFSSIRAQVVEPGQSVYAATKAGILQMARGAASEFGRYGVRVNVIAPGVVETPLTEPIKAKPDWYNAYAAKNLLNRWARAEEIAGPTVFLLSEAASYITGSYLVVDGGWLAADGRFDPPGMEL